MLRTLGRVALYGRRVTALTVTAATSAPPASPTSSTPAASLTRFFLRASLAALGGRCSLDYLRGFVSLAATGIWLAHGLVGLGRLISLAGSASPASTPSATTSPTTRPIGIGLALLVLGTRCTHCRTLLRRGRPLTILSRAGSLAWFATPIRRLCRSFFRPSSPPTATTSTRASATRRIAARASISISVAVAAAARACRLGSNRLGSPMAALTATTFFERRDQILPTLQGDDLEFLAM